MIVTRQMELAVENLLKDPNLEGERDAQIDEALADYHEQRRARQEEPVVARQTLEVRR